METGERINALKRLLGKLRQSIVEELTGKIKASERSTLEYFQSLGCQLTDRFGKVESRLGEVETGLQKVESRLGKVETRLANVEADTKEIKETVSRIEAKLDGLDR